MRNNPPTPAPELEPLLKRAARPALVSLPIFVVAAVVAAGVVDFRASPSGADAKATQNIVSVSASQSAGFLLPIDPVQSRRPTHILREVALDHEDLKRLKRALERDDLLLGQITVWDTMDQDADQIEISSAGWLQHVVLTHRPQAFIIPYRPGGRILLSARADGGGGGITLGAKSAVGRLTLPHLRPGQTLEIRLP